MLRVGLKLVHLGPNGDRIGDSLSTIDFECPEMEKALEEARMNAYCGISVIGVEVLTPKDPRP